MLNRYTTGPIYKRPIVYHARKCMSIRSAGVQGWVGGSLTGSVVNINPISFDRPIEEPVSVADREIYAAMGLRNTKQGSPVCAV